MKKRLLYPPAVLLATFLLFGCPNTKQIPEIHIAGDLEVHVLNHDTGNHLQDVEIKQIRNNAVVRTLTTDALGVIGVLNVVDGDSLSFIHPKKNNVTIKLEKVSSLSYIELEMRATPVENTISGEVKHGGRFGLPYSGVKVLNLKSSRGENILTDANGWYALPVEANPYHIGYIGKVDTVKVSVVVVGGGSATIDVAFEDNTLDKLKKNGKGQ